MNPSFDLSSYKKLDGTMLKLIACLSMFIDHLGAVCFSGMIVFRMIGRLAFPIYCFLLVEGAVYTYDLKKYMLRMGLFALISEIPFDLAFYHQWVYTGHQNVFFTLGFGLLAIWLMKNPIQKLDIPEAIYKFLVIIVIGMAAEILNTDYGFCGIAIICILYLSREMAWKKYLLTALLLIAMGGVEMYAVLALIPLLLYNGRRGRQTKAIQYGFYVFYPAHLLLLAGAYRLFIG